MVVVFQFLPGSYPAAGGFPFGRDARLLHNKSPSWRRPTSRRRRRGRRFRLLQRGGCAPSRRYSWVCSPHWRSVVSHIPKKMQNGLCAVELVSGFATSKTIFVRETPHDRTWHVGSWWCWNPWESRNSIGRAISATGCEAVQAHQACGEISLSPILGGYHPLSTTNDCKSF